MKILYVTTISNTINSFLVPHIKMLINQGNEVDVACNLVRELNTDIFKMGCKYYHVPFQRSPKSKDNYEAYKKIKIIIVEGKYDIVHVHTPIASFITRMACRNIPKIKIIYTVHGFHFFKGASLKNWLTYYFMEKCAANWTDCIVTINNEDYEIARTFKLRQPNSVYHVNGVGVDLSKFNPVSEDEKATLRNKYGYDVNNFILIYVAELNYNKHQDFPIKAIELLKNKIPKIKLLLVGSGTFENKYKKIVSALNLEKYVEFLGWRADVPQLFKLSDISISASRREGLPVNVMEAMATGLPLVVTNCRGNRDLVKDNINGYIIDNYCIQTFNDAVERLFLYQAIRSKFKRHNIEFIRNYSVDNVVAEMEKIYSLVIK